MHRSWRRNTYQNSEPCFLKTLKFRENITASSGSGQILLIQKASYYIFCTAQEATLRITIYFGKNLQKLLSSLSRQVTRLFVVDLLFTVSCYMHWFIPANINCLQWRLCVKGLGRNWPLLTEEVSVITSVVTDHFSSLASSIDHKWTLIQYRKYFQFQITHVNAYQSLWGLLTFWFVLCISGGALSNQIDDFTENAEDKKDNDCWPGIVGKFFGFCIGFIPPKVVMSVSNNCNQYHYRLHFQ